MIEEVGAFISNQDKPALVYSSADPDVVKTIQKKLGTQKAGVLVEQAMATIARNAVENGVRRFVVAGGETSGAVVKALNAGVLHIGPEIAPGVPWTVSEGDPRLALALKSGNFGGPNFFTDALSMLP